MLWPFWKSKPSPAPQIVEVDRAEPQPQIRRDSFINTLSGYGTKSDKGQASKPNTAIPRLEYSECSALYRNNGYARTYADIYPFHATRKGWFIEKMEEDDRILKFESDFSIYSLVKQALVYAGVYGRSAFLIVTKDAANEDSLKTPMPENPGEILNIMVFDCREEMVPVQLDEDFRSKTYMKPIIWRCQPKTALGGIGQLEVHASRLIFFEGAMITPDVRQENQGIEDSIFQASIDAIRQISTIDQAVTNAANELQYSVFKVASLENQLGSDTREKFIQRMQEMSVGRSSIRMNVIKQDEEFEVKQLGASGAKDLKESAKETLCAVTRVPMPVMYGQAPGGLNSDGESHRATWFEEIASYQNDKLLNTLTRLYTIFFLSTGIKDRVKIKFFPLEEMGEQEKANVYKTKADADEKYLGTVITPEYVRERDGIVLPKEGSLEGAVDSKLLGEQDEEEEDLEDNEVS